MSAPADPVPVAFTQSKSLDAMLPLVRSLPGPSAAHSTDD